MRSTQLRSTLKTFLRISLRNLLPRLAPISTQCRLFETPPVLVLSQHANYFFGCPFQLQFSVVLIFVTPFAFDKATFQDIRMIEILPLEDSWGMPLQVKSPLDQATSHAVFGRKYAKYWSNNHSHNYSSFRKCGHYLRSC